MRPSFVSALVLLLGALTGCAAEREYPQPSRSPVQILTPSNEPIDASAADADGPWRVDPSKLDRDAGFPSMLPLDAGRDPGRDAGRDASWGDGAVRDAAPRDAELDATPWDAEVDASMPAWEVATGEQRGPVMLATACATPGPTPPPADPTCRAWPWHTPPCYRTPIECAALHESSYCLSINASGDLQFTGLDSGATCSAPHPVDYPIEATPGAFAQLGADVFTIEDGVVVKHSLSDGSFDVAPQLSAAVFVEGTRLLVHQLDGLLVRFASWADLKANQNGEKIASAQPFNGLVFGANATSLVAAWQRGQIDVLNDDKSRRSFRLEGFDPINDGPILAVDLSEDGKELYLLTSLGIWSFDATNGALLRRRIAKELQGLSCERGLPQSALPQPMPGSPRPGYHQPERMAGAILSAPDCIGPFNGPRYFGETAGPELLVIATFFFEPSAVRDERKTPHILVLTTVESTRWDVSVVDGSGLERIIVNGAASEVQVHSATPIPIDEFLDATLGTHPGSWPTFQEAELRANLEQQTGRKVTEIFGCHLGSNYVVRDVPPLCMLP